MKYVIQLILFPFTLVSRLVDNLPDIPPKILTLIKHLIYSSLAGLAVFFMMLGIWTSNTVMNEATEDLKSVRVPYCIETSYDDPEYGESCMGYEYRYESIGSRIFEHFKSSMLWGVVAFVGMFYLLHKSKKA